MTIQVTCPDCSHDIPVENPHVCGKGSAEEKAALIRQLAIAIHKKRGECNSG